MNERDKTPTDRAWANYEAASDAVTRAAGSVKRARKRFDAAVKARNEAHAIWMRLREREEPRFGPLARACDQDRRRVLESRKDEP